jgi:hypothetical protein
MISPHFEDNKLDNPTLGDLIDVFEDRVRSWLLEPSRALLQTQHGFVSAVCLLLTYFEGYETYRRGKDSKGHSKEFFRKAFVDVFKTPTVDMAFLARLADALYEDGRCGFFHDGTARSRILFSQQFAAEFVATVPRVGGKADETGPIQSILLNPQSFYAAVERHFMAYVKALREPSNSSLRTNFKAAVEAKWSPSISVAIGMSEAEFKESGADPR